MLIPQPSKMKTAFVLLALVVVASMASVEAGTLRKRFLIKEIKQALDKVADFFKQQYQNAKEAFHKLLSGVNFDHAVDLLIPYINSDMTVSACVATCTGAASAALGPLGITSAAICTPLCDGALAKLEEIAG